MLSVALNGKLYKLSILAALLQAITGASELLFFMRSGLFAKRGLQLLSVLKQRKQRDANPSIPSVLASIALDEFTHLFPPFNPSPPVFCFSVFLWMWLYLSRRSGSGRVIERLSCRSGWFVGPVRALIHLHDTNRISNRPPKKQRERERKRQRDRDIHTHCGREIQCGRERNTHTVREREGDKHTDSADEREINTHSVGERETHTNTVRVNERSSTRVWPMQQWVQKNRQFLQSHSTTFLHLTLISSDNVSLPLCD